MADKETCAFLIGEFYHQKGRLWRSMNTQYAFSRETGTFGWFQTWAFDHIDVHTSFITSYEFPGENLDRNEISPKRLMKAAKSQVIWDGDNGTSGDTGPVNMNIMVTPGRF